MNAECPDGIDAQVLRLVGDLLAELRAGRAVAVQLDSHLERDLGRAPSTPRSSIG